MKLNYDNVRPSSQQTHKIRLARVSERERDNGNVWQSVIIKNDNNCDCLHSLESTQQYRLHAKKKKKSSLCHIIVHKTFSQETRNCFSLSHTSCSYYQGAVVHNGDKFEDDDDAASFLNACVWDGLLHFDDFSLISFFLFIFAQYVDKWIVKRSVNNTK